jgi:hypothetical protein
MEDLLRLWGIRSLMISCKWEAGKCPWPDSNRHTKSYSRP